MDKVATKRNPAKSRTKKVSEPEKLLYFLRTCAKDGSSYKGSFQWDLRIGAVNTAHDWDPAAECGKGLHGLLGGQGDSTMLDWSEDAVWVVFSSPSSVDLNGKHKVQNATVCAVGDRKTATDFLLSLGFQGVHGCFMVGGDRANMTGGYRANMTGGDRANMTGGNYAKMTGGIDATMTGGIGATMTGGDRANMTGGDRANMTGGNDAKMTGGIGAMLVFQYHDSRWRSVVAYVGENGILPNVAYKLNENHEVVKA